MTGLIVAELYDGSNHTRMTCEGNKIRLDCFIDGRSVYSALHPLTSFFAVTEGLTK